jgi:signal transduction histidine kinase
MQHGGVRIATYSPDTHTLVVYSDSERVQHQLTQTRLLSLSADESKHAAQRTLKNMDNRTKHPVKASVKTTLRTKGGKALCLHFSFVPNIDANGHITDYFGMLRDISDIKATEEQLALETVKAQEVETVKNAFLRNMSYEIRTPLNSVVGFAELFEKEHTADDEQFFIREIRENSEQLLKLINNILFLSRLDARMIDIKPRMTDYAPIFESQCETGWAGLQQEGVRYLVENPFEQLNIEIDDQNMGIILEQVLKNACQHTRSGSVRVRADYIGHQFVVTVVDTGDGIDKEFLDNIFERFVTTDSSSSGLGLSICREAVSLMGGRIRLKSELGKGTIVWIIIPCTCKEMQRK